jgi:hypothetical protein
MKNKFLLLSKLSLEVINQVESESKYEAIEYFAEIKKLKKGDLLEIFIVEEAE